MRRQLMVLLTLTLVAVVGCDSDGPVPIGLALPLTGDAAVYGKSINNGIQLAFEESQADAEMPRMVLEVVDTGTSADAARDAMLSLGKEIGALAVIGGVTSAEALAMVPAAEQVDRILLSPSASSPEFTGISRNFLRIFPSDFLGGTKMGNFCQTLDIETVVIVAKVEPHAKAIQEVFRAAFERNGGEVLETIEIPSGPIELSGILERVIELKPNAVYLAGFAPDVASMIEILRARDFDGRILTTHAFAAPEIIAKAGSDAHKVFLTKPAFDVTDDNPLVQQFVDAYSSKFGMAPDVYAAHGYDAFKVVAHGVSKGGSFPSDFVKALRAITEFPGVAGVIQFDEKGDVQKFPRVYQVNEDGILVNYEEFIEERKRIIREKREELERKMKEAQRKLGG